MSVFLFAVIYSVVALFSAGCRQANQLTHTAFARGMSASSVITRGWAADPITPRHAPQVRALELYMTGLLAEGKGDLAVAQEAYQRAQETGEENREVAFRLGAVYLQRNDFSGAAETFEKALALDPKDPRPRFLLGVLYSAQGRLEEASRQYAQILSEDPRNLGALSHLADLYILQEKLQEALVVYERLLKERPESSTAHFHVGVLYAKVGDWPSAVWHLKEAVALDPHHVEACLGLAVGLTLTGNLQGAKEQYVKAISLEPANTRLIQHLGEICWQMGNLEEAAQWFTRALSFKPRERMLLVELASVRLAQGRWQEVVELLERGKGFQDSEGSAFDFWLTLGMAYQSGGDFARAHSSYQAAYELSPDDPEVLNALGFLYAEWGTRLEEAERLVEKALAQDPTRAAYLDSLGWIYWKMSRFEEARGLLEGAVSQEQDPQILEHLGHVYLSLGDTKSAKDTWEKALGLKPNNQELVLRMERLLKSLHKRKE